MNAASRPAARRLLFVFGTRPEAIKTAPVITACRTLRSENALPAEVTVCVTAQHRDLLDPVLETFGVSPDRDLRVMRNGQHPSGVAARVLARLDPVLARERPDFVVVQGDTTSAMAAALCAFHRGIPVAHIEAGLRTGDPTSPWPEEMNRVLIGRLASLHFAPTERARRNLLAEGVPASLIHRTGNPGVDALLWMKRRLEEMDRAAQAEPRDEQPLILVTHHRRESLAHGLEQVCLAIRDVLARSPGVVVVFPVHPNPQVRAVVRRLLRAADDRLRVVPPLGYADLVRTLMRCRLVVSDSGGIQEEAPALGKPVVCTRTVTERPEGVEAGAVRLVGTDRARIVEAVEEFLADSDAYRRAAQVRFLYGDGHASERIAAILCEP